MYFSVRKPKGSRNFRGKYRLNNGPRIYYVSLRTSNREVAIAKLKRIVHDRELESVGLIAPKSQRDAAERPLTEHLAEFLADLKARGRCRSHIAHTRQRLPRMFNECGWHRLRDVTADGFSNWRVKQDRLSAKTCNEYLGHAKAFFNWMERQGRITHNPLRAVGKAETRGKETFKRRALSREELLRLIAGSGKRGVVYALAGLTGLRRGEIEQLLWADVHLDVSKPYIDVRAATTKNKQPATIPLVQGMADALRELRAHKVGFTDLVFHLGVPSAATLAKDLVACGIPVVDSRGWRVDFHALRNTFISLMRTAGVSEGGRVLLARHSEWRQTDHYTDPESSSLFGEMGKLESLISAPILAPNFGKTGQNGSNPVQSDPPKKSAEIIAIDDGRTDLGKAVPSWEGRVAGGERGIRTPGRI